MTDNSSIRPLQLSFPEAELTELRRRVNLTRWPEGETVADASQGVQLATMQKLARYWATDYDWRKCEARLNSLPQFMTEIDGLEIHFIHLRSKQLYPAPRSWRQQAYPKLIHYNKLDKGGHFAAWSSRNSFQKRFARVSDRFGNRSECFLGVLCAPTMIE
jgi:hypothetical protein